MLFWIGIVLYLLLPTSFPLALDGIPLATKAEFCAFSFLAIAAAIAPFLFTRARGRLERRFSWAGLGIIVVLVAVKLAFPPSYSVQSCFQVPGIVGRECVWSPETLLTRPALGISRYENAIAFGPQRAWQIGAFNDIRAYNVYGQSQASEGYRIQELRKAETLPFGAKFRLSPEISHLLGSEYAEGGIVTVQVNAEGKTDSRQIPVNQLQDWSLEFHNSGSSRFSFLEARVRRPSDGKEVLLGFGSLLKSSRSRPWVILILGLESLLGLLAMFLLTRKFPRHAFDWPKKIRPSVIPLVGGIGFVLWYLAYPRIFHHLVLANGFSLRPLLSAGGGLVGLGAVLVFSRRKWVKSPQTVFVSLLALVFVILACGLLSHVPATNDATFLTPGDDPMLYSTDAKGLLEIGRPYSKGGPFHFSSKPLFLYLKAGYFALFGSGEHYYSILITTALVFVWSLVLIFMFVRSLSCSGVHRMLRVAALLVAFVSFSKLFVDYGATFAGMGFSEGPAWLCAGAGFALLLSGRSLAAMGIFFALCVGFRTQYVMVAPLLLAAAGFLRSDLSWGRVIRPLLIPLAVLASFLVLNYLRYLPTSEEAKFYSTVATPFATSWSWELVRQQVGLLFPSSWEVIAAFLFVVMTMMGVRTRTEKRRAVLLTALYLVTIVFLDGLVAGNSGYHPRHIVLPFFLTSCFLFNRGTA